MILLRRLLFAAAKRAALDPRVQAKAVELYQREVKPRAARARAELREIAEEADPREDPRAFARKLKERFVDDRRRPRDRPRDD